MLPGFALSFLGFGVAPVAFAASLFFFSLTPCCNFSLNKLVFDFLLVEVEPPVNIACTEGEDVADLGDAISPGLLHIELAAAAVAALVLIFLLFDWDLFDISESLDLSLSEPAPKSKGVRDPPLL